MRKHTKLSVQWFYDLLERGECDMLDFKASLEDRRAFGKSLRNFAPKYDETARDVVAFSNAKGGFLFIGIEDATKEINREFQYDDQKIFDLIRQVQDRTEPTVTLIPHRLKVEGTDLLLLEVPFSSQLHRTSRGEFLIRSNDGNRPIEPHEIAAIQSEKGLIVYDQRLWESGPVGTDGVPAWLDMGRLEEYRARVAKADANNPHLKQNWSELCDSLGWSEEIDGKIVPTTAGLLFAGTDHALRNLPYSQVKYIRYHDDGTYMAHEYSGNIVEIAEACYAQLKSEMIRREFHFDLFHEFADDYSEVLLRELLINALAHRDYSRQQIVEIRKYPTYLEIESPGRFPEGITVENYLRRTNARNPNIMDSLREIKFAEKAGSGFDKIFTELLTKGKNLPVPEETNHSVIFRVEGAVCSEKLMELAALYRRQTGVDPNVDRLLVLRQVANGKAVSISQIESAPYVSKYQLRHVLDDLCEKGFIEPTGRTSGMKYILHVSKRTSIGEKISYSRNKKQDKARQKEAILRYLDSLGAINNTEARKLLSLPDKDRPIVSRLFKELLLSGDIELATETRGTKARTYRRRGQDAY